MGRHQAVPAEQATRCCACKWPPGAQRYLLGPAFGCAVAWPAAEFGPYTTCYNRFVRWRRASIWGGIM